MNFLNKISNEFLFVYYILSSIILKPINNRVGKASKLILLINLIIIISIYLYNNKLKLRKENLKAIFFIIIVFIVNLIYMLLRENSYMIKYFYNFCIYAVIPLILFSNSKDCKKFIYYYCNFSILIFFIYFLDPFYDYNLSETYMNFGFNGMLPCFIGLHTKRKIEKNKKFIILEIIALVELLIFANKGAFLASIIYIFLIYILSKKYKKINIKNTIIYTVVLFLIFNLRSILKIISEVLKSYEINSYSINTLLAALNGNNISLNSRNELWENAKNIISENLILGNGMGSYEAVYGIYTHNIFLDILIYYGITGSIIILIFVLNSIVKIIVSKNIYFKIFSLMILVSWCPVLLLSSNIYFNFSFWIFLFLGISNIGGDSIIEKNKVFL